MDITQISVKMEDKPGVLAEFTKMLNDNNIVIRSITVSQIPGLVLFIVDKTEDCVKLLTEKNYEFSTKNVIAALLPNNPSSSEEIQKIAQTLGDNSVNIDFLYSSFIKNSPMLILHVSDINKARDALKNKGIYLYEKE
ncbi:MAG: ACT domain-containing protein, partial [Promethearchaeota archaeon]